MKIDNLELEDIPKFVLEDEIKIIELRRGLK